MRLRMRVETAQRARNRLLLLVGLTTTFQVMLGAQQARANDFSDWSCKNIPFADKICTTVEATNKAVDFMSDPMGYIAQYFNNAVTSLFTQMIKALLSTTRIDWSDPGFLRAYSMAFAASSVLTVILWLIAVAKRALQGVPPLQAVGESIGYLLMSVVVTALAPAAIAYMVQMFDQAAEAMLMPVASDAADMVVTVTTAMAVLAAIPGGSIIVMFLAMGLISAVAGVWLELIVRDALILAGLVLGTSVFSGLVDKSLWNHVKRWVGVMAAIIASKYVTFTVIDLTPGMLTSDSSTPSVAQSFATVFTAIALFWLALYLPFQLSKFLPILGDELGGMYQARDDFKGRAQDMGSQVGDSFGELKSRLGGGSGKGGGGGGGEEAAETGSEAEAAEAGAAATGVGAVAVAAKEGVDTAKEQGEQAADRGLAAANGGTGEGTETPPDSSAAEGGSGADSAGTEPSGPGGGPENGGSPPVCGDAPPPSPEPPADDPPEADEETS